MIREAELFVMSEEIAVEVIGRIRTEHWDIVIPPMFDVPGADEPTSMRQLVARVAHDDALVPHLLAGATPHEVGDRPDGDLPGDDPHGVLTKVSAAACAAAREVTDGDAVVQSAHGDVPAADYLCRLTIAHMVAAHDIAMHLGSRACPFTEELARGMWERTDPEAQTWRARGIFREPLPMPADVSWRDRFLLSAGRDPHPLHH
jgi:hypothetical protein